MIRRAELRDIPRIRELQTDFEWDIEHGILEMLAVTDDQDIPFMFIGAWQLAAVHVLVDRTHGTPEERWELLAQAHRVMEQQLHRIGVKQVVTWFPALPKWRGFLRRLMSLGWVKSTETSWHRSVSNGQ